MNKKITVSMPPQRDGIMGRRDGESEEQALDRRIQYWTRVGLATQNACNPDLTRKISDLKEKLRQLIEG